MTTPDTRLAERARKLHDKATRQVDPGISSRLRAARLQALTTAHESPHHAGTGTRWLLPGGAFAVIVLAVVTLWQPLQRPQVTSAAGTVGNARGKAMGNDLPGDTDLPPDTAQTDPKLYQNLDFYGWLASGDRSLGRR